MVCQIIVDFSEKHHNPLRKIIHFSFREQKIDQVYFLSINKKYISNIYVGKAARVLKFFSELIFGKDYKYKMLNFGFRHICLQASCDDER